MPIFTAMDKHERGWEIQPERLDQPLPLWNGSYRGDKKRLPKVVQKLLMKRPLTPEEHAELLWRFYELDILRRARNRGLAGVVAILVVLVVLAAVAAWPPDWLRAEFTRWMGQGRG